MSDQSAEFTRDENYYEYVVVEFNASKAEVSRLYEENSHDKGKGVKARKAERLRMMTELRDNQRAPYKEVDFRGNLYETFNKAMDQYYRITRDYAQESENCEREGDITLINEKYLRLWRNGLTKMMMARAKLSLLEELYNLLDSAHICDWPRCLKRWTEGLSERVVDFVSMEWDSNNSVGDRSNKMQIRAMAQYARDFRVRRGFTRIGSNLHVYESVFNDPKNIILLIPEGEHWQDIES